MSFGKLPVFKNLVTNTHGKRRFKTELTTDMISSPLGDFRHTMHVGRGGDVFGDTSFLSDHGGEKARESAKSNPLVRALRNVRKPPTRSRNSSREMSPPPVVSPIIKNAVSLPHLLETKNGSVERFNFKSVVSSPDVMDGSYGLDSGFCTLPRWSRLDKPKENSMAADLEKMVDNADMTDFDLPRTDSLLSFSLDLGPSLMAEVLGVMAKETSDSPGKDAPPVKFNLEGSFGQGDLNGPQQNGHPELASAVSQPGVLREGSPFALKSLCQQDGGLDLHPEDVDGLRETQNFTAERHVLRRYGGSLSYPDSTEPGAKRGGACQYRTGSQQLFTHREAVGGQEGSPPMDSHAPRTLGGHFESGQYLGTLAAQEVESRAPGSWRAHSLSSGQRVPADGEETSAQLRGERHREDYRERRLSPAQEMAFSPMKTEAFAFVDEDDEIRV
ncbi:cdc42 effector protein 4-like [Scyliorhinus torazame]|uniref:cdc42 effector protein 4-like n=1 Tax=Scyliorhinus torazame TaxID=75743 RepID=UPI003B5A74E5